MTWDAYHRRKETLRHVLAIADRQPDVTLTELLDTVDPDRSAITDETELLFELQMIWFQRLSGQLDRLVSEGLQSPELVAVTAWINAAAELPGARTLLDAHRDEPALRKAFAKELAVLAASAGVPARHPDFSAQGQRIQDSAREALPERETSTLTEGAKVGLIARLRSAMAA